MRIFFKVIIFTYVCMLAYCVAPTLAPGYVRDPREIQAEKTKYMYARQEKEYTAKRLNQPLPSGPDCSKLDDKAFVACQRAEVQKSIAESRDKTAPRAPATGNRPSEYREPPKPAYDQHKENRDFNRYKSCLDNGKRGCSK